MPGWLVVGISGVTCGGKTTIARQLHSQHPDSVLVSQDTYFREQDDPRHVLIPELGHFNWDTMSSLDMDRMVSDVQDILKATPEPSPRLLILEGFLLLNDARIRDLCDVMYYVTLDRDSCWARRQLREYEPPDVPGYFDHCVWPMHVKYLAELQQCADNDRIVYIDGALPLDTLVERVTAEVGERLKKCHSS